MPMIVGHRKSGPVIVTDLIDLVAPTAANSYARHYVRISAKPMGDEDCHRDHVSELWEMGDEDEHRAGVSTCPSVEDLVGYFAGAEGGVSVGRAADLAGAYVTVLRGELSDDRPWEAQYETLVHPTAVVTNVPLTEARYEGRLVMDLIADCIRDRLDLDDDIELKWDDSECWIARRADGPWVSLVWESDWQPALEVE